MGLGGLGLFGYGLLGGTLRQLVGIITAFTVAHSVTLALAMGSQRMAKRRALIRKARALKRDLEEQEDAEAQQLAGDGQRSHARAPDRAAERVARPGDRRAAEIQRIAVAGADQLDHVRIERSEIEETGEYDLEGLFIRLGYAIDSIKAKRVVLVEAHPGRAVEVRSVPLTAGRLLVDVSGTLEELNLYLDSSSRATRPLCARRRSPPSAPCRWPPPCASAATSRCSPIWASRNKRCS